MTSICEQQLENVTRFFQLQLMQVKINGQQHNCVYLKPSELFGFHFVTLNSTKQVVRVNESDITITILGHESRTANATVIAPTTEIDKTK